MSNRKSNYLMELLDECNIHYDMIEVNGKSVVIETLSSLLIKNLEGVSQSLYHLSCLEDYLPHLDNLIDSACKHREKVCLAEAEAFMAKGGDA